VGQLTARAENLAIIRKALVGVNIEGTSAAAVRGAAYTSGGKTGTAQVITIAQGAKYNASQMDERHRDHALYMAYAPAEDPKIAIAMVVENVGFGAANAAPIARRAFDYYLQGLYPSEEDMALVRQGKATTPVGTPRNAAEAAWPPSQANVAAGAAQPAASAAQALAAAAPPAIHPAFAAALPPAPQAVSDTGPAAPLAPGLPDGQHPPAAAAPLAPASAPHPAAQAQHATVHPPPRAVQPVGTRKSAEPHENRRL
jgi:penicillin-binding protein 2